MNLPSDVSAMFALLYILAQGVERIVEFFSDFGFWTDPKEPKDAHKRAISLWLVSSVIGVVICFIFHVDFFDILKVHVIETDWLKYSMSGIIVGSGTKPVHDLISKLEKYVKKP